MKLFLPHTHTQKREEECERASEFQVLIADLAQVSKKSMKSWKGEKAHTVSSTETN